MCSMILGNNDTGKNGAGNNAMQNVTVVNSTETMAQMAKGV